MQHNIADTVALPDESIVDTRGLAQITRKATLFFVASIILFGGCFAAISFMKDGDRIYASLRDLPSWSILAVVGLAVVNYGLRAWRYKYYAQCLSLHTAYQEILIYYVAGFAMSMSPGKVGEMARLWFLKRRYGLSYHRGLALQIADRANDVLATLILCLVGLIQFESYRWIVLTMIGCVSVGMMLLMWPGHVLKLIRVAYGLIRRRPRLFVRLLHMVQNISFMFRPRILFSSLTLGLIGWLSECYALYLILIALGSPIGFLSAVFIFSFSNIAGGLTMLPGGLGGVELSFFALLTLNHVPPETATAATIVIRLCTLWFGVSLGFISLPFAVKLSAAERG